MERRLADRVANGAEARPTCTATSVIVYKPLKAKISLRAHNFNSEKLKVNDKRGNPVEIAAVVVWRVEDTAQAAFDVEDYESYVQVQSESAIRSIASLYAYDYGEDHEVTLRGGGDEVSHELKKELEVRLAKAGVVVEEARLTHLAYAPEIAHAMLRRQQAEAVIAARTKIVLGAVSMVDMALRELAGERRGEARRGAQGRDGEQLARRALRHGRDVAGDQHGNAVQLIVAEERKSFLLRLPPELWKELEKWAADELRSVNAQMEYVLRQAVAKRKGKAKSEEQDPLQ